jgi:hypothetical protein
MVERDEYRRRAEEAERLAEQAATPHEREAYARIARGWRALETSSHRREQRGF